MTPRNSTIISRVEEAKVSIQMIRTPITINFLIISLRELWSAQKERVFSPM